jgi:hypothetical protein
LDVPDCPHVPDPEECGVLAADLGITVSSSTKNTRRSPPDHSNEPRTIGHLPGEVLAVIFAELPMVDKVQAALVCRRWRSIVSQPQVWREVVLCVDVHVSADGVVWLGSGRFLFAQCD